MGASPAARGHGGEGPLGEPGAGVQPGGPLVSASPPRFGFLYKDTATKRKDIEPVTVDGPPGTGGFGKSKRIAPSCSLTGSGVAMSSLRWKSTVPRGRNTFSCVCARVCMHVHACVCMCVHVRVHVCVCMCTHMCSHVCTHVRACREGLR